MWLLTPSTLVVIALVLVLGLLFSRRFRAASRLLAGIVLLLLLVALLPVPYLLAHPLEARFTPNPELPSQLDGIVVLGGVSDARVTARYGEVALGSGAERLTRSVELARQFPNAQLLFTGGPTLSRDLTEADLAARFYTSQGIPASQLLLEHRALNTYQNALFSYELVKPSPTEEWVLVTSAWHMPRAVAVFRTLGWEVIPYPVDYFAIPKSGLHVFAALNELDFVTREWLSLVAFRILGYTSELLPTP